MATLPWEITHSVETNASPAFAWHYWTNIANWDDPPAEFELVRRTVRHRVAPGHAVAGAGAATLVHPRRYSAQRSHDRDEFGRRCIVV